MELEISQAIHELNLLLKKQECKQHIEQAIALLDEYPDILGNEHDHLYTRIQEILNRASVSA
jgi:hypothetical protein